MSISIYQHKDILQFNQAIGKQAAALIRLALVSGGHMTLVVSTEPEMEGIVSFLAASEGIDWSKVTVFSTSEFLGVARASRVSLQNDIYRKLLSQKQSMPAAGLINGEGVPSTEVVRLSTLIKQHSIDLALLSSSETGSIGMTESMEEPHNSKEGYFLCEPSDAFRKSLVHPNRFKSINEVPRRGITLSTKTLLRAKNILFCLNGSDKSNAAKCLAGEVKSKGAIESLKNHTALHLHLGPTVASPTPETKTTNTL